MDILLLIIDCRKQEQPQYFLSTVVRLTMSQSSVEPSIGLSLSRKVVKKYIYIPQERCSLSKSSGVSFSEMGISLAYNLVYSVMWHSLKLFLFVCPCLLEPEKNKRKTHPHYSCLCVSHSQGCTFTFILTAQRPGTAPLSAFRSHFTDSF